MVDAAMSAHFDGAWYPRSCDMCGCPCAPMKVGSEYLCDICREFNETEAAKEEERKSA